MKWIFIWWHFFWFYMEIIVKTKRNKKRKKECSFSDFRIFFFLLCAKIRKKKFPNFFHSSLLSLFLVFFKKNVFFSHILFPSPYPFINTHTYQTIFFWIFPSHLVLLLVALEKQKNGKHAYGREGYINISSNILMQKQKLSKDLKGTPPIPLTSSWVVFNCM